MYIKPADKTRRQTRLVALLGKGQLRRLHPAAPRNLAPLGSVDIRVR
ncbi:MAG: hypothetical protein ACYCW6_10925 [Candidatus Xenobia bacterium]